MPCPVFAVFAVVYQMPWAYRPDRDLRGGERPRVLDMRPGGPKGLTAELVPILFSLFCNLLMLFTFTNLGGADRDIDTPMSKPLLAAGSGDAVDWKPIRTIPLDDSARVNEWGTHQVAQWLASLGLSDFIPAFQAHRITVRSPHWFRPGFLPTRWVDRVRRLDRRRQLLSRVSFAQGDILEVLDETHLRELGVSMIGHRVLLLREVSGMRRTAVNRQRFRVIWREDEVLYASGPLDWCGQHICCTPCCVEPDHCALAVLESPLSFSRSVVELASLAPVRSQTS